MSGDVRRTTAKKRGDDVLIELLDEKNKRIDKYNRYVALKQNVGVVEFEKKYRQKQKEAYKELMDIDQKISGLYNGSLPLEEK